MSLGSDSAPSMPLEDLDAGVVPGSVIAGKYQVEHKLGAGGMGVVVAARHLQLGQLVAIKFLLEGGEGRGINTARFLREARAAASLKSEHVARVVDMGTLPSGDPFMVMEHLAGRSLSKAIKKTAPMPVGEAVGLMLQACDALGEAHARGIIHRDVKPSNMFLTKRNDGSTLLKVLDFGISKAPLLSPNGEPTLTQAQMVLGTPQYLSPEQFADVRNVDQRTDIWALGVILYYMLCGRRPFKADSTAGLCLAIATEQPVRPIELRPDLPPELDTIIMHCLEKDRDERMESAAALATAIAPFAAAASRVAVEQIGVVPDSTRTPSSASSASAIPVNRPALPMAQAELVLQRPDSQTSLRGVQTKKRAASLAIPQILAGVAVVGVVAWLLVGRQSATAPDELGGVAAVSGDPATPPKPSAAKRAGDSPRRSVLVPGSANPVSPTPKTKKSKKRDIKIPPMTANMVGTAQAHLRLFDRAGGQNVIGKVRKGEIVVVKKVSGEWALVSYATESRVITGWTIRNLVR